MTHDRALALAAKCWAPRTKHQVAMHPVTPSHIQDAINMLRAADVPEGAYYVELPRRNGKTEALRLLLDRAGQIQWGLE